MPLDLLHCSLSLFQSALSMRGSTGDAEDAERDCADAAAPAAHPTTMQRHSTASASCLPYSPYITFYLIPHGCAEGLHEFPGRAGLAYLAWTATNANFVTQMTQTHRQCIRSAIRKGSRNSTEVPFAKYKSSRTPGLQNIKRLSPAYGVFRGDDVVCFKPTWRAICQYCFRSTGAITLN